MKTTLRLVAAVVVALGLAGSARAAQIDYFLQFDAGGTWTLSASTDAPGGIAAVVVNLVNVQTGVSVAPRRENIEDPSFPTPNRGFTVGNLGSSPAPGSGDTWNNQAFAAQNTTSPGSLRKGIGFAPQPADHLGVNNDENQIVGDVTVVPTVFYTGTWDTSGPTPDFGAPIFNEGLQVAGAVFASTTPSDPIVYGGDSPIENRVSYTFTVVPEPSAFILAGLAIPALVVGFRRRKAAKA